ncbi:MAG TPA: hypothetical protein VM659_22305 [Dongiaceae bacterium]|nr:hypothetical protein [Dongiaceae bacterium]
MLASITGMGGASGGRASGPTSNEISMALRECGSALLFGKTNSATKMLLADIARHFSSLRILSTTQVADQWHAEALVNFQSRGAAPVSLKIQFELQQQEATWAISAAQLLQS